MSLMVVLAVIAASPYRNSTYVTGVEWDLTSHRRDACSSDLFVSTYGGVANTDHTYTAWGDGYGFEDYTNSTNKTFLGLSTISGTPSNLGATDIIDADVDMPAEFASTGGVVDYKPISILAVDGNLVMNVVELINSDIKRCTAPMSTARCTV